MKLKLTSIALLSSIALSACSGEANQEVAEETAAPTEVAAETLSNGLTALATIEARQKGFKGIGGSFKTIRDQLQSGSPDASAISAAADKLAELADDVGNWFPEGSGMSSGVKTEALDKIWEDPEGYTAAVVQLQTAAAGMKAAADSGDLAAVGAAVRPLGMSCKNCHDSYRLEDD